MPTNLKLKFMGTTTSSLQKNCLQKLYYCKSKRFENFDRAANEYRKILNSSRSNVHVLVISLNPKFHSVCSTVNGFPDAGGSSLLMILYSPGSVTVINKPLAAMELPFTQIIAIFSSANDYNINLNIPFSIPLVKVKTSKILNQLL